MMQLHEALNAIAPVLKPTLQFLNPKVLLEGKMIKAYNGLLYAQAPLWTSFDEPLILDAQKLSKVWLPSSMFKVTEKLVTITTEGVRYRLNQLAGEFYCPPFYKAEHDVSGAMRDAIVMAAKFASENAIHPWACGVALDNGRAVATNNVSAVSVECPTTVEGTLPFWSVASLRDQLPRIKVDDDRVVFEYADGVTIQSAAVSEKAPAKLFDVIRELSFGTIDVQPYRAMLAKIFAIGGKYCTLSNSLITVDAENGDQVTCDVPANDQGNYIMKIGSVVAELVFTYATHLSFAQAPERLIFSRNISPRFVGIASGVR